MSYIAILNESADFWFYTIGVNVITANTKKKETYESWSQWQDKPIPEYLHEERKKNGYYNNGNSLNYNHGLAIIPGQIWRGPFKGKYLIAIDLDNKKAIEDFCGKELDYLKQNTIVEQHSDPNKMHIYFIVDKPIPNKASDKTNTELLKKIDENEIPAFEVKSSSKYIMYCSNSPHRNGSNYQNVGAKEPIVFNASQIEERISQVCNKYKIHYGSNSNNNNNNNNGNCSAATNGYQIPIKDLWKTDTKILQGHNRHLELLRIMESELQRNRETKPLEDIKLYAHLWNQKHCDPPLDDREFEKEWKQALEFITKNISSNNNNNNNRPYYNGNGSSRYNNNNRSDSEQRQNTPIILPAIEDNNYFEYIVNSVKKTVKQEDALIRQILYTAISSYVEDDPINLGVLAPTSEGKTYAITESLQYFPDDVVYIGQMSPMVLVRQKGILVDKKTGEPIKGKHQELKTKLRELVKQRKKLSKTDIDEKEEITKEIDQTEAKIEQLLENSKTLIDLGGKILVFLEPPKHELWNLLKPILSHDKKEIEFPFVDRKANSNAETRDVVVRGWPSCIFCSAKDESKWEIWNEIKSRILVTSPNMIPEKYKESNQLISRTKGLPNLIQQQIIISNERIENTKNCVLAIKQKINELKSKSPNGKISLWIPYYDLLQKELPANKGTDVRYAKKIFSMLNIIPIVKNDLRNILKMEGESSIIADLQDLREVLIITQNFDGLPKFKAEFFNNIFLPCYGTKTERDVKYSDDGKKIIREEDRIAVTTKEICEYFKSVRDKPISSDNLKHTYLNQLINEGIVDHLPSKIDLRQDIYFPLVTEKISITSIINPIDNLSQENPVIYEKITRNIDKDWILSEIKGLVRYRLDQDTIEDFDQYVNDPEKFKIIDSNNGEIDEEEEEISNNRTLSLEEFIAKYIDLVQTPIDIQWSKN